MKLLLIITTTFLILLQMSEAVVDAVTRSPVETDSCLKFSANSCSSFTIGSEMQHDIPQAVKVAGRLFGWACEQLQGREQEPVAAEAEIKPNFS